MDPRAPRAEAFAVSGGRFVAVGSTSDIRNLAGKNTQTFDAKGMTVVPGFIDCHNHAGGEVAAQRSARRQSVRGRVRQHPQHHRQAARARAEDAAGAVGRGLLLRRHQGERQARDQHSRSRRSVIRASGDRPPSRRPHLFLQQQGVRDGRHHQGHAEPDGRHLRQGCERQPERPRHRSRVGAVQQGRDAPDLHAGGDRNARARRRRAHLEAVRALRPHQRASRRRQPAGDAGRARPRRSEASHQL